MHIGPPRFSQPLTSKQIILATNCLVNLKTDLFQPASEDHGRDGRPDLKRWTKPTGFFWETEQVASEEMGQNRMHQEMSRWRKAVMGHLQTEESQGRWPIGRRASHQPVSTRDGSQRLQERWAVPQSPQGLALAPVKPVAVLGLH